MLTRIAIAIHCPFLPAAAPDGAVGPPLAPSSSDVDALFDAPSRARRPNPLMLARPAIALVLSVFACGCSVGPGPLPHVPSPEEAAAARAPANAAAQEAEAWRVTVDAFVDAIRPHVGHPPIECNGNLRQRQVTAAGWAEPEALRAWARCLDTARATGRPTLVLLWQRYAKSGPNVGDTPGPPSWTVTGSLGLSDGRVEAFTYTALFGSRRGTLTYGPCTSPTAQDEISGPFGVRCSNEDVLGNVRMTWLPPRLFYGLAALTGEHPVNCNASVRPEFAGAPLGPLRRDLVAALDCARVAIARGEPFYVAVWQTEDTRLITGLAGTPAAGVQYFEYDDAASADSRSSGPRFDVKPCRAPIVTNVVRDRRVDPRIARDLGDFGCSDEATRSAPPSRRRPGS